MAGTGMYLRSAIYRLPAAIRLSISTRPPARSFSQPPALAEKSNTLNLLFLHARHTIADKAFLLLTDTFKHALHQNKQWAQATANAKPDLFPTLASGQQPQILWIGCSDSRVPETTVLGLHPGDVFVHRNIANILPPTDINSRSVISYAVQYLKVKHIVVCGHMECGGVKAALGNDRLGLIDAWLMPLRKLRAENKAAWDQEGLSEKEKTVKLMEANVRLGVQTLKEYPEVIDGMRERGVVVHGLVYHVESGELRELEIEEEEHEGKKRKEAFGMK